MPPKILSKAAMPTKPAQQSLKIRDAMSWLARGASLIALTERGKVPLEKGWPDHPIKTEEEVAQLFGEMPNANYGIITGSPSGLICIDIDGQTGHESLRQLQAKHDRIPRTLTVMTDRGYHLYFRYPGVPINNSAGTTLGPGIDIRGDGGYVVGVGSRHPNGSIYEYAVGRGPNSLPIAALPPWLLTGLTNKTPEPSPKGSVDPSEPKGRDGLLQIAQGARNQHLASLAGRLHNAGISSEALVAALWAENEQICDPPLERSEVEKIGASIGRYIPKNQTGDEAEDLMRAVLDAHFAGGTELLNAADGQFWRFNGTHWTPLPRKALDGIVLQAIQAMPSRGRQRTSPLITQTVALLGAATASAGDTLRFNDAPLPVINCRNGELWIRQDGTVQLKPHNPASYLRHCLAVDYDPAAICPLYDKATAEIFSKSPDMDDMQDLWDELVGYAIQPDRPIARVVIARGTGNNGKTALVETLVRLVGQDLVAALPIQELDQSRFTIGSLLGKLLLIDDDMKAGTKLPDGQLKRLSEAKTVTGENKFGPQFTFRVRTLPILLCNNPPSLADLSYGMTRRLMVVPFDRQFEESEVNRELFPTIWATEMSGVLNRGLAGLRRVIERGWQFDVPESALAAKEAFLGEANPLPGFIKDRCEATGSCWLSHLYRVFEEWATANGITRVQQKSSFKRNLESRGFVIVHGNQGDKVQGLRPSPR